MTAKQRKITCLVALLAFAIASSAEAQHSAAHVHGEAGLTVVVDGADLIIELTSPAADLAGFESSPETAGQRERVQQVNRVLESLQNWMRLSIADLCTADIARSEYRDASSGDDGGHAEFHAHHELTCDSSDIPVITVNLFDHFPDLEVVSVQWIADSGQGAAELSARSRTLAME